MLRKPEYFPELKKSDLCRDFFLTKEMERDSQCNIANLCQNWTVLKFALPQWSQYLFKQVLRREISGIYKYNTSTHGSHIVAFQVNHMCKYDGHLQSFAFRFIPEGVLNLRSAWITISRVCLHHTVSHRGYFNGHKHWISNPEFLSLCQMSMPLWKESPERFSWWKFWGCEKAKRALLSETRFLSFCLF